MILEVGAGGIIEIPFNRTRYEYHQYGLWGPHGVKKGEMVLDTNGDRVLLGSELHERHEEDKYELSCFGLRKKLIRRKGDLKLNYANRAILKPVVKEMLDPYAMSEAKNDKPEPIVIESIFEIHKRDVFEQDEYGNVTDNILAHRGTQVFNQHGAPVYKTDTLYVRHLFDVVVHGIDGSFTHKEGDLFINSKGRAQEKPSNPSKLNNVVPKVVFNGIKDGELSSHIVKLQEQIREARSVKGISRNLKHYKDRELMKLFDKVNTEIIKRGLKVVGGYQPVIDDEFTEPKNPPRGR